MMLYAPCPVYIVAGRRYEGLSGFSINKIKRGLRKIAGNVSKILPPPLRKIDERIRGAADRLDRSVSKDFMKTKKWAQKHRKELQAVAAVAAIAVGGYFAFAAFSTGAAGAGAAAAGAGAGAAGAGAGAAAAGASGSLLSSIGSGLLTAAKVATTVVGLQAAMAKKSAEQSQAEVMAAQAAAYQSQGGGSGYATGGGGGGGGVSPMDWGPGPQTDVTAQPAPSNVVPLVIGGAALLFLLTR